MIKVAEKIIGLASAYLGLKYNTPLSLHSEMKPLILEVQAPMGAYVGMAWVYHIVSQACNKLQLNNPLMATAWPLTQLRHCSSIAYKANKPFFFTNKPVVIIDFLAIAIINPEMYIKSGDIFLIANDCGQYRCGFVLDVKPKEFITIEPSLISFETKRRKYKQLSHVINSFGFTSNTKPHLY